MLRGDIYRYRLPKGVGHEQFGKRYCIVLQSNDLLPRSVVIVAPTSLSARPAPYRPEIKVENETTRLLVEQLNAVDPQRFGKKVGSLTYLEQAAVDEALTVVLGLAP